MIARNASREIRKREMSRARIIKSPTEHQSYWPYSQLQMDKIPLIDSRLYEWKELLEVCFFAFNRRPCLSLSMHYIVKNLKY